jgi:hypothetical protein
MFFFSPKSKPALGLTQPPIQWVPEFFTAEQSGRGIKLTAHLVLRLTMSGDIHPQPSSHVCRCGLETDNFILSMITVTINISV